MEPIFQRLLVTPLFEKPGNDLEMFIVSSLEALRIMQNKEFVLVRNKLFVDRCFSACIMRHSGSLNQGKTFSTVGRLKG